MEKENIIMMKEILYMKVIGLMILMKEWKGFYTNKNYQLTEFKNGKIHGKGKLINKIGNVEIEGDFINGKLNRKEFNIIKMGRLDTKDILLIFLYEGEDKFYDRNGSVIYKSQFKKGLFNGKGI